MTPYHFDNKQNKEKVSRKKIAIIGGGIIFVGGVLVFIIAPWVRTLLLGPQWLANTLGNATENIITSLTPKSFVVKENKKLKEIVESYQPLAIEATTLRQENEALHKELSYTKKISESILAEIIAKPNRSLYNSLIINQGLDDGVMVGQRVVTQGIIGLGEISAVSKNTATVILYSGPQFNGDLVIKNEKNIFVPAIGKGSGNFEIHIPREITIADGDLLALPENQNMIVGVVKSVVFDARNPFQTVLARIPVNVQELRFVQIIK